MNWNKVKRTQYVDIEGKDPRKVYSDRYFNKLKAKAIEIAKTKSIYDFRRYDATQSLNGKPKPRYSSMATGANNTGKDWVNETGIVKRHETYDCEVQQVLKVTTENKQNITRYKGNVADLIRNKSRSQ